MRSLVIFFASYERSGVRAQRGRSDRRERRSLFLTGNLVGTIVFWHRLMIELRQQADYNCGESGSNVFKGEAYL